MFAELAFFSLVELTDPSQHGAYNRWHQLDHRPENLALPGVAWGDRWSRPEEYAAASTAVSELQSIDYLAMYWIRPPVDQALAEWDALGETSFQWGRGPLMPGVQRRMLAFFKPVKGYAAQRALVSPEALPYRPNRGLHVTLTRFAEPHSAEAHAAFAHEDRELIPELLCLPGVAGAWTFSFSHPQRHSSLPFDESAAEPPGSLRIRLLYLDGDPLETGAAIAEVAAPERSAGEVRLASPFKTIIPWQDW